MQQHADVSTSVQPTPSMSTTGELSSASRISAMAICRSTLPDRSSTSRRLIFGVSRSPPACKLIRSWSVEGTAA